MNFFLAIFLITALFINPLIANGTNTGTLIVTYQTNQQGERLNRIRFGVQGSDYKLKVYPKSRMYVDDPNSKTRRVVIENLPEGQYSIIFLVPNTDNYFVEVPARKVTVTAGAVVKCNQVIKPKDLTVSQSPSSNNPIDTLSETISQNTGSLIVSYSTQNIFSDLEKITFELTNEKGFKVIHPQSGTAINARDNGGRVVVIPDLLPGKYELTFFRGSIGDFADISKREVQIHENTPTTIHEFF